MSKITHSSSLIEIFEEIKYKSEDQWKHHKLRKDIYGFQIQNDTSWLPGLSEQEIEEFEILMGFSFPEVFKCYLRVMNGTDKDTINLYGSSGVPYSYSRGYLSYPRDIETYKDNVKWIYDSFQITSKDIEERNIPHIMPIVSHRYIAIDRCNDINPVLSMYGDDVIIYASSLIEFLNNDLFNDQISNVDLSEINVPFWIAGDWE